MKRIGILNGPLSGVIARMGHGDSILVCDAGMPAPANVLLVDLAVVPGLPAFIDVVAAIATELKIEQFTIADELIREPDTVLSALRPLLRGASERTVSHEQLKLLSRNAIAVVRTGEFTPYANVLLTSGVIF